MSAVEGLVAGDKVVVDVALSLEADAGPLLSPSGDNRGASVRSSSSGEGSVLTLCRWGRWGSEGKCMGGGAWYEDADGMSSAYSELPDESAAESDGSD